MSEASITKTAEGTGFVEDELQAAWKIADVQDEKKFTIVPVRLEECGHGDHRLSTFQQYDLFEDFEKELDRLAVHIGGISLADAKAADERTEDEKLIESLSGKAEIAYYSGEYIKAISMYDVAINVDPGYYTAWYNKGVALLNTGNYQAAIAAFDKAIELKQDNNRTWSGKGLALSGLGKHKEAIAAYNKAITIQPDNHYTWTKKGEILEKSGKHKEARQAFAKAEELKEKK